MATTTEAVNYIVGFQAGLNSNHKLWNLYSQLLNVQH